MERTVFPVVSVAQHGEDKLVIGQRLIDKTLSRRIDGDDSGFGAIGHRVWKNPFAAIRAPKPRRRSPLGRARDSRIQDLTVAEPDTQSVAGARCSSAGNSTLPDCNEAL